MLDGFRLNSLAWAAGLVVTGVLLLLFNFDLMVRFEPLAQYVLAGVFGLGGVGFLGAYLSDRRDWARLIPAWTLLALGVMVLLSTFATLERSVIGAALFVGLALAFGHVYITCRDGRWWAIIPSGFMLVLGLAIGLSGYVERIEILATILLVGMGFVFFSVYLLVERGRHWWALVPGTILSGLGVFVFALDGDSDYVLLRWWPSLLVVAGLLVGLWGVRRKQPRKMAVHTAPRPQPEVTDSATGEQPSKSPKSRLGEYTGPAPGATVDILPESEER